MKNLIIGSSGIVGRALELEHIKRGKSCHTLNRGESLKAGRHFNTIYYCAGKVANYGLNPLDTVEAHVGLLGHVLTHFSYERIIYLSSTRVYDGLDALLYEESMDLHLNPHNPRHLYDLSKVLGENLCFAVAGSKAIVARLSCVFDPVNFGPGFLSELLQRATVQKHIHLDSAMNTARDYIALQDVVDALLVFGQSNFSGVFNLASGSNTSNAQIKQMLEPFGVEMVFSHSEIDEPPAVCCINKINDAGIFPRNTVDVLTEFGMLLRGGK